MDKKFFRGRSNLSEEIVMSQQQGEYRFSFGPWNIDEGADPFGPPVREPIPLAEKMKLAREMGFDGLQFHDDDAVEDLDNKSAQQIEKDAAETRRMLENEGLVAEFVAPRLWFAPETIDGAFTNNDPTCRQYAIDRAKKAIDVLRAVGAQYMVLWPAREGTYIRETKSSRQQTLLMRDGLNALLDYDKDLRILVEPKPNEPMDSAIIPTIGHAIALGYMTKDPARMGCLVETAHSMLTGLDPSDDMGYALAHGKLWSVHINDQGGLKFDQDKSFGSYNLRHAFNQVRVLEEAGFGRNGEWVGLDVKTMRTQKQTVSHKHLANSRQTFLLLLEKVRSLDKNLEKQLMEERDYEELDRYILNHLMGAPY